ncbi:hypothetical protein [Alkaliphilus peptidifermentans]|uniref:Uncharacterized protein n=1 Tax=Alkaliphilus peptidifermentans DSM 18978 TaxID=1120976 RepID=A0A1G5I829_9FIRM|nr:hypothetical protein [Alkaliphilus peptidifermentans]SCY72315.1 hypothetical protein SAMN03080606_02272 [Alkaliphilus peptidifermentans DSM 18978]
MKKKSKESFRNPQDIIDETYNGRDYDIINKSMNSYVMPLDMVKDVDAFNSQHFYQETWDRISKEIKNKPQ